MFIGCCPAAAAVDQGTWKFVSCREYTIIRQPLQASGLHAFPKAALIIVNRNSDKIRYALVDPRRIDDNAMAHYYGEVQYFAVHSFEEKDHILAYIRWYKDECRVVDPESGVITTTIGDFGGFRMD